MVNFNLQSTFCEQALKEKYHVNIDGNDDVFACENVEGRVATKILRRFWGRAADTGSIIL